ncbi:Basic helix-loop-helix transcription factor [Thalictrum thalictroides]|uniref:Basic helix-loop-helix transcription factor n=1 Tax=Thalictrum thalictroides TaxID=46969 RepID=A0A7J6V7H9_THATH|nr:Basic helix-loop-helix transcription factor [Thalictrum thalictroides]
MATGLQNQELIQGDHLRKQLAIAVRSIQWSYAILWSSTKQQGVLEWTNGYYNGDIKTRKTMQPMELNVDKLGLKRSEQLKELYECLAIGEANEQAKRPSASLSPEDLSDAEWYYLVCMSFTFAPGVGLPGRSFANNQHIWHCNAQYADSKIFSRSLLAKSASIQKIICFPWLGGVIEMGGNDLVEEDLNLLQNIKTIFLEFPKHTCCQKSISTLRNDDDPICEIDHDVVDTMVFDKLNPHINCGMQAEVQDQVFQFSIPEYNPLAEFVFDQSGAKDVCANFCDELKADSQSEYSDGSDTYQQTEDSFMMEGANGVSSQVQSWQFMDDDFSNGVPVSMNSSDCISQTFFIPEKLITSPPKKETVNDFRLLDLEDCSNAKFSSLDLTANDLHYTRTLSAILGNSNHLIAAPCSHNGNTKTSFVIWRKGSSIVPQKPLSGTSQKMLKKILFEVPLMHGDCSINSTKENGSITGLPNREHIDVSHFLWDKKEKLNDSFLVLRSLVPSMNKLDKGSVLGDTIEYLKDLERRVEELESRGRNKCTSDIAKKASDNYFDNNDY